MYQFSAGNRIKVTLVNGSEASLPAENNGTPEWREHQAWLAEGNEPLPAPEPPVPPVLTPEQKLANAGLTVDELKTLLGLS